MDSEIEWSPVRSIASAAADERQQLASQAATELRMRSLQVRHPVVLSKISFLMPMYAQQCSLSHSSAYIRNLYGKCCMM